MFPEQLYTAGQCRELDLLAIATGVPGYTLMCRAGAAAYALLLESWPQPEHIHLVCGAGNNGGDGLVVARLAHQQQLPVTVYFLGDSTQLQGEALLAWQDAVAAGVDIRALDIQLPLTQGVIVDALLGIGLIGDVRANAANAINWINHSGLPVLALDIPSGICADTGKLLGAAVKATRTITFIAAKRGLFTGSAVDYTGNITLARLDVPEALYSRTGEAVDVLSAAQLLPQLAARPRNAHKGLYGHVLVIGGNSGMAGAALMAATAAARSGAGLVSVATLPEHLPAFISQQPELMVHGVSNVHQLSALSGKATVVLAGPGLGQNAWAEQMLYHACASGLPLVLDADALNLISAGSPFHKALKLPFTQPCVLTPHPGEAARLLATDTATINVSRFSAAQQLQQQYRASIVLKGAGTVLASDDGLSLCPYGNPGMASGGMGDVLSGIIAGLMAQGMNPTAAAQLAVVVHAQAADRLAAQYGQRGLLATDLIPAIRQILNAM